MAVIWLILSFILGYLISNHSFKFLYLFRNVNSKNAFFLTSLKVLIEKAIFTSVGKSFFRTIKNYYYLAINHYERLFLILNQNVLEFNI